MHRKSDQCAMPDWTPTKADFESNSAGTLNKTPITLCEITERVISFLFFFVQDGARIAPEEVIE